ncbi:hypothetical protein C2G38_2178008 [Gigaspora rosea]|uniref:Uncharacterized protein n=1 Tax=Gigaspora rosea TaxID=44941 RepID=A0A397VHY1_9GLOM|nr:hypothetical protein C2G38_2178008 [Gigaspora rosea]
MISGTPLSNSYISICDLETQNTDISESQFTQSKLNNPLVPIVENKNMSHSIEKRQTKGTQNNKHKIKLDLNSCIKNNKNTSPSQRRRIENSALKELFKEQNISWNQKEFVKECQSRNICLDDDVLLIQPS